MIIKSIEKRNVECQAKHANKGKSNTFYNCRLPLYEEPQ